MQSRRQGKPSSISSSSGPPSVVLLEVLLEVLLVGLLVELLEVLLVDLVVELPEFYS